MEKCSKQSKLHIAMFPWFAMGHVTPYLHLSNELAARGHQISFLLPNKAQLQLQHLNLHPDLITFHPVAVPHVDGLPPGTETTTDIGLHPFSLSGLLFAAFDLTRDRVQELLGALKPDLVFYDLAYWIPQLAIRIGFKTVCYITVAASTLAAIRSYKVSNDRPLMLAEMAEPPLGYPSSTVVLHPHEARVFCSFLFLEYGSGISFYKRVTASQETCDAISLRTCRELEGQMCDYVANHYGKPLLLTGPVLPVSAKMTPLESKWATWLGGFNPSSVVFCAFGSESALEKYQFQELLLGFELTGLPFLVALKLPNGAATIEEALPEGYEDRVRGRGVVYGGWVQQPQILEHPSVGCFVSHCGFGSMWESLLSDNQIVLLPNMEEQILNTRLLAEELKVAVEVKRDESGWVSKECLCEAILSVMDKDSEVGCLVKKNHAKWKQVLSRSGFISGYIDEFIQKLYDLFRP